jgi:hypothetical protein
MAGVDEFDFNAGTPAQGGRSNRLQHIQRAGGINLRV